jgi:hypothetical protein
MRRILFLFSCVAAAIILMSGCAASRLDADFGTSYKLAKINQIMNPNEEKNLAPVYGIEGTVAEIVMDNYKAGFKEKAPAANYIFSVGGVGAGQ